MKRFWFLLFITACLLVVVSSAAWAMSSAHYRLDWFVPLTGTGVHATSMHYGLQMTVGQPVGGLTGTVNNGLGLGFWHGLGSGYQLFAPLLRR